LIEKTDAVGSIILYGHVIDNFHKTTEKVITVDHLRGVNMAFRRHLLPRFDERLLGDNYRFELDACMQVSRKGRMVYDPAIIVYHYLAPRVTDLRRMDYGKLHNNIHNNTYVLLKNLPLSNKLVFLLYAFLWGGHPYIPGVFYVLGRSVKHLNPWYLIQLLLVFSGILHGVFTYCMYAISTKKK
jgi:hypothetical protein